MKNHSVVTASELITIKKPSTVKRTTIEISDNYLTRINRYKGKSFTEKLNKILSLFFYLQDRYPNMLLDPQNPDTWNYPPCQFLYPKSYGHKFMGFHCLNPKPPLNLPKTRIGKLMITLVEPDLCLKCCEISLRMKIIQQGKILPQVSLEVINVLKSGMTMLEFRRKKAKENAERERLLKIEKEKQDRLKAIRKLFPFYCTWADRTFKTLKNLPCGWGYAPDCKIYGCKFYKKRNNVLDAKIGNQNP